MCKCEALNAVTACCYGGVYNFRNSKFAGAHRRRVSPQHAAATRLARQPFSCQERHCYIFKSENYIGLRISVSINCASNCGHCHDLINADDRQRKKHASASACENSKKAVLFRTISALRSLLQPAGTCRGNSYSFHRMGILRCSVHPMAMGIHGTCEKSDAACAIAQEHTQM